jgi:mannose-6-phosphate isomerase-like protein (cupin superfamily)
MEYVIDVEQIEVVPGKNSDNQPIIRRDDLKISLLAVRAHAEMPLHAHEREEQFYYVLSGEGIIRLGDREFALRPGVAVDIPPGVLHQVRNPNDVPLRYLDILIERADLANRTIEAGDFRPRDAFSKQ